MTYANSRPARVDGWMIPGVPTTLAVIASSGSWSEAPTVHVGPIDPTDGSVDLTVPVITCTVSGDEATAVIDEADMAAILTAYPPPRAVPWSVRTGTGETEQVHALGFLSWDLTGGHTPGATVRLVVGPAADTAELDAATAAAASSAGDAADSATAAADSATAAANSATAAATSASGAATSATAAAGSATAAAGSASAASGSASSAATSAGNAAASETAAANSATAAATSAISAANSETAAAGSASSASTAATNAANSATSASGSASTATTQASNASTSATNAANSATAAGTSATNAATSASNAAATLANAVVLTGDQTIAGTKTFSAAPVVPDASFAMSKLSGWAANALNYGNASAVPTSLSVAASRLVGRGASGDIAALDATAARTVLGLAATDGPSFSGPTLQAVTAGVAYGSDAAPALSTWTGAGGATWGGSSWTIPAGGAISCTINTSTGTLYEVGLTTSATSGSVAQVSLDAVVFYSNASNATVVPCVGAFTGTVTLTLGGDTWAGTVTAVTFRSYTPATPLINGLAPLRRPSGSGSMGLGYNSLSAQGSGAYNNGFGYEALAAAQSGSHNSAVGYSSLKVMTSGVGNSSFGNYSLMSLKNGSYNVGFGYSSLTANINGSYNVGLGTNSLLGSTGSQCSALGSDAGRSITTGTYNTFLGSKAGYTDGTTTTTATVSYALCLGAYAQATVDNVAALGGKASSHRLTLNLGSYDNLGSNIKGGIALANAATAPTTNPAGGGLLYAEGGALKWRGSSGTVTTIANA